MCILETFGGFLIVERKLQPPIQTLRSDKPNDCFFFLDDHTRGLSTFTVLAGCGGTVGYALGSVDWDNIVLGKINFHLQQSK